MAINHGTTESTGYYMDVTPAQWRNFDWAFEPHQELICELRAEAVDSPDNWADYQDLPTPIPGEEANLGGQCYCNMRPGGQPGQYHYQHSSMGFTGSELSTKYPNQVFISSVWCLEDFLYRIGTQLADMTGDALGLDLTIGQYAGQMKSVNNCADKISKAIASSKNQIS